MIGTALKRLAAQYQLTISRGMAYGYLQGSFVTLTDEPLCRRLSIYVGSVQVAPPEGTDLSPAAQCAAVITDMVNGGTGEENIYALTTNRFFPAVAKNHDSSVVTVNFRRSASGMEGLQRFIAELLPRITPLTAPLQCSHCGGHTGGQGYPMQIAADTAVPMHAECPAPYAEAHKARCQPVGGIVGAAAGALLGAALLAVLIHAGIPAAIGMLGLLLLTVGGYLLMQGRSGWTQMTVIAVCMVAGILLGTLSGYAWLMHDQYLSRGTVVASMISESAYIRIALKDLFAQKGSAAGLILSLCVGLLLTVVGAGSALFDRKGCAAAESPRALPGKA